MSVWRKKAVGVERVEIEEIKKKKKTNAAPIYTQSSVGLTYYPAFHLFLFRRDVERGRTSEARKDNCVSDYFSFFLLAFLYRRFEWEPLQIMAEKSRRHEKAKSSEK